jgi:hypothetical protein
MRKIPRPSGTIEPTRLAEGTVLAILGRNAKQNGITPRGIGGVADHVHLLLSLPITVGLTMTSTVPGRGLSSVSHTARRARPEGARKLSPGFTLGKAKYTFRPEGARNADAVRFEGSEPILAVPGGPFRANSGGWRFPRVNPGLCFLGHFGP